MEGVQAYDCSHWHEQCPAVDIIECNGILWLWCATHRHLTNMQAVSPKFDSWDTALSKGAKPIALEVSPAKKIGVIKNDANSKR